MPNQKYLFLYRTAGEGPKPSPAEMHAVRTLLRRRLLP
jgi:hypothetical protein